VEPRYNDVPREWWNYIIISGYRYKRIPNITILEKNNHNYRYIGVWVNIFFHAQLIYIYILYDFYLYAYIVLFKLIVIVIIEIDHMYINIFVLRILNKTSSTRQKYKRLGLVEMSAIPFRSRDDWFYCYIGVNFTFGLLKCDRYIGDIVIPWIVKSGFCSIHFTVILAGWKMLNVISGILLYRRSLYQGSTVLFTLLSILKQNFFDAGRLPCHLFECQ